MTARDTDLEILYQIYSKKTCMITIIPLASAKGASGKREEISIEYQIFRKGDDSNDESIAGKPEGSRRRSVYG